MDTYYLMDEGVLAILAKAEDPRDKRGKVHSMEVLLAIAICAYLSNGNTFERMECFAEEHEAWLCEHVGMESAPCADTFNRLFQALKPESIVQLLQEVSERLRKNAGAVKTIAVDGKTLRGSAKGGKSIRVLNAWASGARRSIGQLAVESKSNEITHVPQLLQSLDLKGYIVTADALNTQASAIQSITQDKGDYVLPLKANHPTHQSVVSAIMRDIATAREPDFEQVEKGHWCLDVIFREDTCRARLRNAARNLSALRVLCLNLLRHSTLRGSLRIKRLRLAFNPSLLETLLASV